MTTARDILLEVKRRLGDTNAPYPDEADALAYLNRALLGVYNYGAYKNSDRLRVVGEFASGENGAVVIHDGVSVVNGAICKDTSRVLSFYKNLVDYMAIDAWGDGPIAYAVLANGTGIKLYPVPPKPVTVVVDYIPQFSKVKKRNDAVPFCPQLENVICDWTCGLILGRQGSVSDLEFAVSQGFANTLGQYFRGPAAHSVNCGQGPW